MYSQINQHHLKDKSFRALLKLYPEESHENLKLPGKFIKTFEIKLLTKDNRELEPDTLILVNPDNDTIHEKTIINLEHQSYPVDLKKIKTMREYRDNLKCEKDHPIYSIIVTSVNPKKSQTVYEYTPSDILKPKYIYIGENEIEIKLNNLKEKIKNNEKINCVQALDFIIVLIFSPYKKQNQIFKTIYNLLKNEKTINPLLKSDIITFLERFNGRKFSEKQKKELSNMAAPDINRRKEAMRILFSDELAEKDKEINKKQNEINTIKQEKDKEINKKQNEINTIKQKYHEKIEELKKIEDLNTPQAQKILESLLLIK